ncbi:MAG: cytidine deaminase [Dokdonella sp.]
MMQTDLSDLREQAENASRQAHAPYSGLSVGAALRSASGQIHRGCNVENAAFPLGSCAERGAIAAAVLAEGPAFGLVEIAVIAKTADGTVHAVSPCGACRQLIAESGPTARVGFYSANSEWIIASTAQLLPYAFVMPEG